MHELMAPKGHLLFSELQAKVSLGLDPQGPLHLAPTGSPGPTTSLCTPPRTSLTSGLQSRSVSRQSVHRTDFHRLLSCACRLHPPPRCQWRRVEHTEMLKMDGSKESAHISDANSSNNGFELGMLKPEYRTRQKLASKNYIANQRLPLLTQPFTLFYLH